MPHYTKMFLTDEELAHIRAVQSLKCSHVTETELFDSALEGALNAHAKAHGTTLAEIASEFIVDKLVDKVNLLLDNILYEKNPDMPIPFVPAQPNSKDN